jgi:hypothetical protein
MKQLRFSGQSLLEYSMIAALVTCVCLAGLMSLGSALSSQGGLLLPGSNHSINASTDSMTGSGSEPTSSTSNTNTVCFSAGQCIQMPNINPTDMRAYTAGALGSEVTQMMASVLDQLKEQLQLRNADPNLINLISQLANQGHAIGDKEQSTWDSIKSCMNLETLTCNSKPELYDQTEANEAQITGMSNQMSVLQQQLATYLVHNPNALTAFPEAQSIIDKQASQIIQLASNIEPGIGGNADKSQFYFVPNTLTSGLENQDASTLTHLSANEICKQGGKNCMQ